MSQTTYPFDPLRSNALCVVTETLLQPTNAFKVLFPTAGPFYQKEFTVTDNGRPMKEGVDFFFTHRYVTGTHQTAQRINGSIWIVNAACTGPYALKYHTLGGQYLVDAARLAAYLPTMIHPAIDYWELVMGEDRFFPPVDIQFDRDAFIWEPQLIAAINSVSTAITNKDEHKEALTMLVKTIADITDKDMIASVWDAHMRSKGPVHGETHFDAGALHKTGIAQNTLSFEDMGLDEITEYILGALDFSWITVDKFPLLEDRTLLADMLLRDGLACLAYRNTAGALVPIFNLDYGVGFMMVDNNILINADYDNNGVNGGAVVINAGSTQLVVNSSYPATDDSKITINGKQLVTTDALFKSPAFANRTAPDDVKFTNTLDFTLSGTGKPASPLKGNVNIPVASPTSLGVAKLLQDGSAVPGAFGISQKAVTDLKGEYANLLPVTRKINGKPLSADVTFDKSSVGLSNVENVADVAYPVVPAQVALLQNVKAPADHVHDFSQVVIADASTMTYGIGLMGDLDTNPTSILDGGVAAAFLANIEIGTNAVNNYLPNGAMDMVRYGVDNYLTAPVTGVYPAAGQHPSYPSIYGEFENDGSFVFLRNGMDINGSGVYYGYCDMAVDGTIAEYTPTSVKYAPDGLAAGDAPVAVLGGSNGAFLLKGGSGVYVVITDGTMRPSHHHACLIGNVGLVIPIDATVTIVSDEVWLVIPTFSASYARFSVYVAKLADVLANKSLTFTAKSLTGADYFGVTQTAVSTFRFAATGYIANTTPGNSLFYNTDAYVVGKINPRRVVTAIAQQGDYIRLAFEINVAVWSGEAAGVVATPMIEKAVVASVTINRLTGNAVVDSAGEFPIGLSRAAIDGGTAGSLLTGAPLITMYANLVHTRNRTMAFAMNQVAPMLYPVTYDGASVSTDYYDQIDATKAKFKMLGNKVDAIGQHGSALDGAMYGWGELGGNRAFVYQLGKAPVELTYTNTSGESISGLGPTATRKDIDPALANQLASMVYVSNGAQDGIAGAMINSKDGIAYSSLSGDVPGGQIVVNSNAFVSANAAVRALNLYPANYLIEEYGELIVPTDPSLPAVYLYSWTQYDDSTLSRVEAHSRLFEATVNARAGTVTTITVGNPIGSVATQQFVVDASYPVSTLGNCQIGKLDDGNFAYVVNSRFGANCSGYSISFSRIAVYVPGTGWNWSTSANVRDQTPTGWGFNRTLGAYLTSSTQNREELYALVRGKTLAAIKTGSTTQQILQTTHIANSWFVNFTSIVKGFMMGAGVVFPIKSIDLRSVGTPYTNRTFYLYAVATGGVGDYMASLSLLGDLANRILIGTAVTGSNGIIALSCNARTRLLSYRELEEHLSHRDVHGYPSYTKVNAGLAKLANKGNQNALAYPPDASIYSGWITFKHAATGEVLDHTVDVANWKPMAGTNLVQHIADTTTFNGYVSTDVVGDYTFSAVFVTQEAVKTETALVLAFFDDLHFQHTLSLVRSNDPLDVLSGDSAGIRRCAVYYDYGLPTCKLVKVLYNDGLVADAVNLNWRIKAIRKNDTFTISCSPIIAGSQPGSTMVAATDTFTLDDLPELGIFKDTNRYGYAVRGGKVNVLVETDPATDPVNNYATYQAVYDELYWTAVPVLSGVTTDGGTMPLPAGYTKDETFTVLVPFAKDANTAAIPMKSFQVFMDETTRKVTALMTLTTGAQVPIYVEYYVMALPTKRSYN